MLPCPMDPLPASPEDPRLAGGYHTIQLTPEIRTRDATYDHAAIADRVGLPRSLVGMSALDVGTADGFWAFEMEARGASPVVAVEIPRLGPRT